MNILNYILTSILSFRAVAVSSNVGIYFIRSVFKLLGCRKAFDYLFVLMFTSIAVHFFVGLTPARGLALMIIFYLIMRVRMVGTFEWEVYSYFEYLLYPDRYADPPADDDAI